MRSTFLLAAAGLLGLNSDATVSLFLPGLAAVALVDGLGFALKSAFRLINLRIGGLR